MRSTRRGAFFTARHEAGAVCMADAWARVTGRVGVVQRAPGARADERRTASPRRRRPDAAAADRRRHARRPHSLQLPHRSARPRPSVGASPSASTARPRPPPTPARALRRAELERGPVVLNCRSTCRPSPPSARPTARVCTDPGDAHAARGGGRRRRRPAAAAAAPAIVGGRGAVLGGRRARARGARRTCRRPAGHLRDGARTVRRRPVGARHLGRLRLAARGRAAAPGRPRARVRRDAQPLDDAPRRAHRPARALVQVDLEPARDRRQPPRRPRRRRRRRRGRGGGGGRARRPRTRGDRLPHRRGGRAIAARRWRDEPYEDVAPRTATSTRATSDRARRPAAARPDRRDRLRALHGLPGDVPRRPGRAPLGLRRTASRRSGSAWPARSGPRPPSPDR